VLIHPLLVGLFGLETRYRPTCECLSAFFAAVARWLAPRDRQILSTTTDSEQKANLLT
jgi:hypothetical protein